MAWIQHEHLIGYFDIAHAVLVNEVIDLSDHRLRAPEAITIDAFFPTRFLFSGLKRRLNTAETTMERTSEGCVERGIGLAFKVSEAVPVVRSILVHGQKIPCEFRDFAI